MTQLQNGTLSISLSEQKIEYECDICKDTEWIMDATTNTAKPCKCREVKLYKRIIKSCGITEAFLQKNFENFSIISKQTEIMHKISKDYAATFALIREKRHNSLALLGSVGSGKTHLTIAVANELMKNNIGVRYMQYREDIPRIKQVITNEVDYNREIGKYKHAPVLLIDDLYKNAIGKGPYGEYLNDADKRVMFEIINHRYFNGLPIIVSSECDSNTLLELDEGIGSRIIEMCKGHLVEIKGKDNNYRVRRCSDG